MAYTNFAWKSPCVSVHPTSWADLQSFAQRSYTNEQGQIGASLAMPCAPHLSGAWPLLAIFIAARGRARCRPRILSSRSSIALCAGVKEGESREIEAGRAKRSVVSFRRAALLALAPLPTMATSPTAPLHSLTTSVPYAVIADGSLPLENRAPTIQKIAVEAALRDVGGPEVRAVFLGEHHDSEKDHQLQAAIIRALSERRPVAVGLEAVQRRFQPVLDAYVRGELTEAALEAKTDWRVRWFWPFERYLPVFRACKELQLPLVALNVDSEDLGRVEIGGLPGIDVGTLRSYVPDPSGFADSVRTVAFKAYERRIIKSSYDMHKDMGILRQTITGQTLSEDMTYRNFLSGRLLWDAGMASRASAWLEQAKPNSLLVGLIGADHVKFGCGVPARCAQALGSLDAVRAVMLNTKPQDTSEDIYVTAKSLTLQMPFAAPGATQDVQAATVVRQSTGLPVLPVANLLWYSA